MSAPQSQRQHLAQTVDTIHGKAYDLCTKLGTVHGMLANTDQHASDFDHARASCRDIADTFEALAAQLRDAADPEAS